MEAEYQGMALIRFVSMVPAEKVRTKEDKKRKEIYERKAPPCVRKSLHSQFY